MFKLLVVDDEPAVLLSIKEWLQSETLAVEVARTGQHGLALARQFRPDAVILDLPLGDAPGMVVFDRLRAFDARLPVILITALAGTETAIEAMKRGAFEHLLKPVDYHLLRDAVQRALEGNARQVQGVLKYAIVQGSGDVPTLECLPENLRPGVAPAPAGPPAPAAWLAGLVDFTEALLRAGELDVYRRVCLEMDRVVLRTALHHVKGNQVKASELLGISRTTLRAKLRALNHDEEKPLAADAGGAN